MDGGWLLWMTERFLSLPPPLASFLHRSTHTRTHTYIHTPKNPNQTTNFIQVEAPKRLVELSSLALEGGFFTAQLLKVVVRAEVGEQEQQQFVVLWCVWGDWFLEGRWVGVSKGLWCVNGWVGGLEMSRSCLNDNINRSTNLNTHSTDGDASVRSVGGRIGPGVGRCVCVYVAVRCGASLLLLLL